MKKALYEIIIHMKFHKKLYLIVLFILFIGISCGSVTANKLNFEQSVIWGNALGGTLVSSQGSIFLRALLREGRIFGLLLLCSAGVVGIPLCLFLVSVRGFILGFTISFLVSHFGMQGFWLALSGVLPQSIIIILVLIFFAVTCMDASINKKWGLKFWTQTGGALIAVLIGIGFETLLCSLLPGIV